MKSIHSLKTYNQNPNFSIVVPCGCNAKCNFCFWKAEAAHPKYLSRLKQVLVVLPSKFRTLSITGGEPTLDLDALKQILKRTTARAFNKVVMSTNGCNLQEMLHNSTNLSKVIQHLNISRHHWDENINDSIFQSQKQSVPTNSALKEICERSNYFGIDVTLSAVLTEHLTTEDDILHFVDFAKQMGASSVFFRKPHGTLDPSAAEVAFAGHAKRDASCPVCRASSMIIKGMPVTWKASVSEPDQVIAKNQIYELVFHANGTLSSDWAQQNPVDYLTSPKTKPVKAKRVRSSLLNSGGSCRGGCL